MSETTNYGELKIVETIGWRERGGGKLGNSPITALCFVSDNEFITGSEIGELCLWSIP